MDAVRLIGVGRRALAASSGAPEIMIEAWQAQSLAQAVGSRLAVAGPPELRGEALGLSEIGGRGCGALTSPLFGVDRIRAAQLSGIGDAHRTLTELGKLLTDVGIALVQVASAADDRTYWQCMEAIDAADECRDRVLEMLRRLAVREESEAHSRARGPQEDGSGHEFPRVRPQADCVPSVPAQPVSPQVADRAPSSPAGPDAAGPAPAQGRRDRGADASGARAAEARLRDREAAGPGTAARSVRPAPDTVAGLHDGQPPGGRRSVQQVF